LKVQGKKLRIKDTVEGFIGQGLGLRVLYVFLGLRFRFKGIICVFRFKV
jgi:hypothetical protein